jgi:hypothetical protein
MVPITTNVVGSPPTQGEMYNIMFIKVCQWHAAGGFPQVLRFPPPIKLTPRYNWNIVESGVKHHKTKPDQSL